MTGSELNSICVCPVVHPNSVEMKRCIGAKPIHKTCGGIVEWWKRSAPAGIVDDRPEIEVR